MRETCLYKNLKKLYFKYICIRKFGVNRIGIKERLLHPAIYGGGNNIDFAGKIQKVQLYVMGNENSVVLKKGAAIEQGSYIEISGNNNKITVESESILRDVWIEIYGNNCELSIGKNTIINKGSLFAIGEDHNSIEIGDGCQIARGVYCYASDMHTVIKEGKKINVSKPIKIGNHVWIGSRSTVLKGTIIRDDVVVGAGSVVAGEYDRNQVVVGNPARIVNTNVNWTNDPFYDQN